MHKKVLVILIIVTILFTNFIGVKSDAENDLTTILKENLMPLKTTEAGNGLEDLMPLKEIFKDKKIIGMGEATHGTKEFFQMKHRMFEFLVEEMGYRVFAIEAEFGGSQVVNDYILNGNGSIQESLDSMKFWTWNTQEVAYMIEWMKVYNENATDENKIKFYGFDMQSIDNSVNQIINYLNKVDEHIEQEYKQKLQKVKSLLNFNSKKTIEGLSTIFVDKKDEFISKSSQEEYDLMIQHIVVINQCIHYYKNSPRSINEDFSVAFNIRDKNMAQNVKWILDYETKYYGNNRVMLWAHNGHISMDYFGNVTMGNNLRNTYGNEYYSLGFNFYEGGFRALPISIFNKIAARKPHKFYIKQSPSNSYGYEMEKTGIPISFLDFKDGEKNQGIKVFLSDKIQNINIGAGYLGSWFDKIYLSEIVPNELYDGFIFVKSTNASEWPDFNDNQMKDGNQLLIRHYLFSALPKLLIGGFLLVLSYKKVKSESLEESNLFGKVESDKEDIKGIKRWILKLNEYVSEISTTRYIVLTIIILFIINLTLRIDNLISWNDNINMLQNMNIRETIILILNIIIENFKFHFLPLTILAYFSENKAIKISHIIIASLVLVLFRFRFGNFPSIIIYFLNGIIINYSYTLYYHKNKKPFIVINTIKIGEKILSLFI